MCDTRHPPFVYLTHHMRDSLRTADFLHDFPQAVTIHHVEGFRHVRESSAEVGLHFLTFVLQLAGAEDHVSGSVVKTESTPAFWEKSLVEMAIEKVQEDASEDLLDDVVEGDVSVVTTELFVPFPFLEMVDCHILEVLRDFISELRLLE
ncbi:hypothetical protein SprV_0602202100 [Sparganum proliferum]